MDRIYVFLSSYLRQTTPLPARSSVCASVLPCFILESLPIAQPSMDATCFPRVVHMPFSMRAALKCVQIHKSACAHAQARASACTSAPASAHTTCTHTDIQTCAYTHQRACTRTHAFPRLRNTRVGVHTPGTKETTVHVRAYTPADPHTCDTNHAHAYTHLYL